MKDVLRVSCLVLGTVALLFVVWRFRSMVLSFYIAVMMSAVLAPGYDRLQRLRVPQPLAIVTVYMVIMLFLAIVPWLLYDGVLQDLNQIVEDLDEVGAYMVKDWTDGSAWQRYLTTMVPADGQESVPRMSADGAVTNQLLGWGGSLTHYTILAFLIFVVSIYWSIEYDRLERLWLVVVPFEYRGAARQIWRQIQVEVGNYLRSELLQAVLVAALIGFAFWATGFPYPIVLAFIISATWMVPWLGAILAVMVIWGASLLNFMDVTPLGGLARSVIGSGIVLLVFVVLKVVLEPRLMNRKTYSSLFVIIVTVASVQTMGAIGLIIGPPISIALQVIGRCLFFPSRQEKGQPLPTDLAALQPRLDTLQQRVATLDHQIRLPLDNLLHRLNELVSEAKLVLPSSENEERLPETDA